MRQQADELESVSRCLFGLDAPGQIGHDLFGRVPGRFVGIFLDGYGLQDANPVFGQEVVEQRRQCIRFAKSLDCPLCAFPGFGFFFALDDDIRRGQCGIVFFAFALTDKSLQLVERGTEHFNVAFEFGLNPVDEFGQFFVEGVALIDRAAPANRDAGNAAQKAPCRMLAIGKETGIEHHDLEHRNLQATDQRLDGYRDVCIFKNEVEEHGHDVDRDGFDSADLFGAFRFANDAYLIDDCAAGLCDGGVLQFVERGQQ